MEAITKKERWPEPGEKFEFTFAVDPLGGRMLVTWPADFEGDLLANGCWLEEAGFTFQVDAPDGMGHYKGQAEFWYIEGFIDGWRARGEDEWGFRILSYEKFA